MVFFEELGRKSACPKQTVSAILWDDGEWRPNPWNTECRLSSVLQGNDFSSVQKILPIAIMKPIRELLTVPVGEYVFAIKNNEASRKSQSRNVLRRVRADPHADGRV